MIVKNIFLDISLQVIFGFLYTITNKKALIYNNVIPVTISICQLFITFTISLFIFYFQNKKLSINVLANYKKFIPLSLISCGSHIFSIYVINMIESSSGQLFKFFIPIFSIIIGYIFYDKKFKLRKICTLLFMSYGIFIIIRSKKISKIVILLNFISNIFTAFRVYENKKLLNYFRNEDDLLIFCVSIFFTLLFSFPLIIYERHQISNVIYNLQINEVLFILYSGIFYFLFYGILNISLKNNTPLTQTVSGLIVKIFNVLGSIIFFSEKINKVSIVGYSITFLGFIFYFFF